MKRNTENEAAATVNPGGRKTLRGISLAALFAALIAAGTFISIPLPFSPVPIVLQNLFVVLAGLVLGPALGAAAAGLYLTAGIIGAPVFAGASGGLARLAGPTGGFLAGYLPAAFLAGLIAGLPQPEKKTALGRIIAAAAVGLLAVYAPGVAWLKISTGGTWTAALIAGCIPFIPGDIIKGAAACAAACRLRRAAADILSR